jgi:hypothetical protein
MVDHWLVHPKFTADHGIKINVSSFDQNKFIKE